MRKICSIENCDNFAHANGWCLKHWKRWKRNGDPNKLVKFGKRICSVSGCDRFVHSREKMLCLMHWKRWKRHGDPTIRVKKVRDKICTIPGCSRPHYCLGFCIMHRNRIGKNLPMTSAPLRNIHGQGTIDKSTGYKLIPINGNQIYEHRHIMEKHLKRPLLSSEIIHHINGNKLDNNIKNLVLISRSEHAKHHHSPKKSNHL